MKENQAELLKKLLQRLDIVAIVTLTLLAAIVGYLVLVRESTMTAEEPGEQAPKQWERKIPGPAYEKLKAAYPAEYTPLAQEESLRILLQNDMFSLKAVKERDEERKRVNESLRSAEDLFRKGQLAEAEQLVNRVLQLDPTNVGAASLKKSISDARASAPAGS